MINNKKNKTDTYIIPDKAFIRLSDVKAIVKYCDNGCNVSDKCKFFEKCQANSNFTMVKLILYNDITIRLSYKEYIAFEKVFIENGYISEPIFIYK